MEILFWIWIMGILFTCGVLSADKDLPISAGRTWLICLLIIPTWPVFLGVFVGNIGKIIMGRDNEREE